MNQPRETASPFAAAALVALAGLAGLVAALYAGGVVTERIVPGFGDAGPLTRWGLPVSRMVMDVSGALTTGALVTAAFLLPAHDGRLGDGALRYVRGASWLAAVWSGAAAAAMIFTVSDLLQEPVTDVLTGGKMSTYVGQMSQATALLLVLLLAVVIALFARTTSTSSGAAGLVVLAFVTLVPPALTGHSAAAANHTVAVTGLAIHVLAIALWTGGLAMIGWHARRGWALLPVAAERYSRMALWCYVAVAVSGMANVVARLPDPFDLFTTRYGNLVLAKVAAFALLGWAGWRHRERTLPAIRAGKPRAFARLATAEVAVMAATMGVAVALARTAPPVAGETGDVVRDLIGYGMPPELTLGNVLSLWRFDLLSAVIAVTGSGLYLAGVFRLRRRGDSWPVGRTISWLAGLATIVVAIMSGVGTYSPVLFSMHMVQHMVLSMLSPILLVLGAPATLALRGLKPAAIRGDRGPREWLTTILHSPQLRIIAHPAMATALFIGSTYALYFTGLFEYLMETHLGHIGMSVHFLVTGYLFFWVLIGVDPGPRRLPYLGRILVLFVTMPFHAFFGISLMMMSQPIAEGWYDKMRRPWGPSVLSDQNAGGAIAWGFGEIPTLIVILAIVFQWAMADQRLARRQDRQADRAEGTDADELAEYNAYLASLEKRSRDQ